MPTWIRNRSTLRPRRACASRAFPEAPAHAFRRKRTAARRWGTARSTAPPTRSSSQDPSGGLFPVVLSGLMAVSLSQLAAAQKVDVQGPAGTGVNADLNKGGTVAPDVQNSQQIGGSNQSNQQQGSKKKEGYGSASGGASSN